jgi:hypothetical protein
MQANHELGRAQDLASLTAAELRDIFDVAPIAVLHTLFTYNPDTGALRWKLHPRAQTAARVVGELVGSPDSQGYLVTQVLGRHLKVHRIVWAMIHGAMPAGLVDHADGDVTNNRPDNLRLCTPSENQQNRTAAIRSETGVVGATWHKRFKKFQSQIRVDGGLRFLGYFPTVEEAHAAYAEAKRKLHPFAPVLREVL